MFNLLLRYRLSGSKDYWFKATDKDGSILSTDSGLIIRVRSC
jgi:hypothetical protein